MHMGTIFTIYNKLTLLANDHYVKIWPLNDMVQNLYMIMFMHCDAERASCITDVNCCTVV